MKTFIASGIAAAALVSAASADVTFSFTNQTWTNFNFTEAYVAGSLSGTLTGVSVNATLNASVSFTYADDLCVYMDAAPLGTGGLLQVGGFSNLGATQRYVWANGGSSAPGTTVTGTVIFTTGINLDANPLQSIWIGNGYGASGTSGTWTGTITLIGVDWESGTCAFDTDLDGRPDCIDNCTNIANPTQGDCNSNSIGDVCEIAAGAPDYNQDTIPDTCQCIADLFVDGQVNGADLGALLAFWGPANPSLPSADINRDGSVDGADLGYLLYAWGPCTN